MEKLQGCIIFDILANNGMHYLVNAFLFFFIYYLIWFLGNSGEPITHDTWVLLLLKYDDQETQTVWKTRTDTQPKTNYME